MNQTKAEQADGLTLHLYRGLAEACLGQWKAAGVVGWLGEDTTVALGLLLSAYGAALRRRARASMTPRPEPTPDERRQGLLIHVLLTLLVAVALFWWVGDFAAVVGRGLAYRVAANLDQRPGVVVYSQKDLQISAPRMRVTHLEGDASAYAYRYEGLRLLERSAGRLFLLPDGWAIDNRTMVVLVDDDKVRVEYTHASG